MSHSCNHLCCFVGPSGYTQLECFAHRSNKIADMSTLSMWLSRSVHVLLQRSQINLLVLKWTRDAIEDNCIPDEVLQVGVP